MLSDDDIAALVEDFYATILRQDDSQRLMSDEPDAFRELRVEHYQQLAERTRIDLASNAFNSVRQITAVMLARRYGTDAKYDKASARQAAQEMLRAGVEIAETLRARAEGDFNYEPGDKLSLAALAEHRAAPLPEGPSAPPQPVGEVFSIEADRFRETQLRRGVWEKQTALQARKTCALFLEHFGDRPLASFARTDAAAFKNLLSDLPFNYGKAAEYRGKSAADIVAATRDRKLERLSPRTIQRHFNALAAIWAAAIERGEVAANIFAEWKSLLPGAPATSVSMEPQAACGLDRYAFVGWLSVFPPPIEARRANRARREVLAAPDSVIFRHAAGGDLSAALG